MAERNVSVFFKDINKKLNFSGEFTFTIISSSYANGGDPYREKGEKLIYSLILLFKLNYIKNFVRGILVRLTSKENN